MTNQDIKDAIDKFHETANVTYAGNWISYLAALQQVINQIKFNGTT